MEIMVASLYSAANLSGSSVSPGFTWVKRTGCSVISRRNDPADLDERAQVEPIMPGHIEGAPLVRKPRHQQPGLDGVERRDAAIEARAVAHDADLVPHGIEQLFA